MRTSYIVSGKPEGGAVAHPLVRVLSALAILLRHSPYVRRVAVLTTLLASCLLTPLLAHAGSGDLLQPQQGTVSSTFGHGSTLEKWFYIFELFISIGLFIKTRSPLCFLGLIMVVIATRIGFGIIG